MFYIISVRFVAFSPHIRFTITNPDSRCTFSWTVRLEATYSNTPDPEGQSRATCAALRGHHMHVFATGLPGQTHHGFTVTYTCSSAVHLHLMPFKLTSGNFLPEADAISENVVFIFQSYLVLVWCFCHLNSVLYVFLLLCMSAIMLRTCVVFFCRFPANRNLSDRGFNIRNLFLSFWVCSFPWLCHPHSFLCHSNSLERFLHKLSPGWQQRLQHGGRLPRRQ